jgi:quercetin dioxygenase-like cupin family protein
VAEREAAEEGTDPPRLRDRRLRHLGQAELVVEGQTIMLEPGDSWLVPAGAEHAYHILSEFTAVEATSPPAQVHARDE